MRVLLADDQVQVRSALRKLLKHRLNMRVVGEAFDANSLRTELEITHPDLLLLDWGVLGIHPGEALPALHARYPLLRVIVMSGYPEVRRAAMAAGADAFVSKSDPPEQLLSALKEVSREGGESGVLLHSRA
jgi:DNA-binding NarL/FixJ family response regulator